MRARHVHVGTAFRTLSLRAHLMPHVTIVFFGRSARAKLRLECNTAKHVKKEQRQVNKKFCELKGGNIGIVEKAQETRFKLVCLRSIADTLG